MNREAAFNPSQAEPCVPFGNIRRLSEFKGSQVARKLAKLGDLPVLSGRFNSSMFEPTTGQPQHVGWGVLQTAQPLLSFRMQVGADMLYWLANATDPEVWEMLEVWHKKRTMVIAAEFDDASAILATRDFELVPSFLAFRPIGKPGGWSQEPHAFLDQAGKVLLSGDLARRATTDIPTVPQLRYVQGCTIATKSTGRAVVPHELVPHAMCNLIIPRTGRVEFAPMLDHLH